MKLNHILSTTDLSIELFRPLEAVIELTRLAIRAGLRSI